MERYKLEACAKAIGVKPDEPGLDKAVEIIEGLLYQRAHLIGEVKCHLTKPLDADERLLTHFEDAIQEVNSWHGEIGHYGHVSEHDDLHYHLGSKVARRLLVYLETNHKKLKDHTERKKPKDYTKQV